MNDLQFTKLDPPEKRRAYVFPGPNIVAFENVTAVCVRPSGTHRLETADGMKHIVNTGWLAITLEMDAWTF